MHLGVAQIIYWLRKWECLLLKWPHSRTILNHKLSSIINAYLHTFWHVVYIKADENYRHSLTNNHPIQDHFILHAASSYKPLATYSTCHLSLGTLTPPNLTQYTRQPNVLGRPHSPVDTVGNCISLSPATPSPNTSKGDFAYVVFISLCLQLCDFHEAYLCQFPYLVSLTSHQPQCLLDTESSSEPPEWARRAVESV